MAITFKGSAASFPILGNDETTQNLFSIENAKSSRVNVIVKHLEIQNDAVAVLTTFNPLIKASKITTAITGGMPIGKVPFDTSQSSSSDVTVRAAIFSTNKITATPGNTIWQQFVKRVRTAVEQQISDDYPLLPTLVEGDSDDYILVPGESLLVSLLGAATTSNAALTNNWFVQIVWEEDSIGTFAISGTVTLDSSPVDGAKVLVVEASDESLTDATIVEILTTNSSGQWSSTIKSGRIGAAFVQYKDGSTYYTAPGSPFLEE